MPINSRKTVTMELSCDNPTCKKTDALSQEEMMSTTWLFFKKINTPNSFMYEKTDPGTNRVYASNVRMHAHSSVVFCSSACAMDMLLPELQSFLFKPITRSTDTIRVSPRMY